VVAAAAAAATAAATATATASAEDQVLGSPPAVPPSDASPGMTAMHSRGSFPTFPAVVLHMPVPAPEYPVPVASGSSPAAVLAGAAIGGAAFGLLFLFVITLIVRHYMRKHGIKSFEPPDRSASSQRQLPQKSQLDKHSSSQSVLLTQRASSSPRAGTPGGGAATDAAPSAGSTLSSKSAVHRLLPKVRRSSLQRAFREESEGDFSHTLSSSPKMTSWQARQAKTTILAALSSSSSGGSGSPLLAGAPAAGLGDTNSAVPSATSTLPFADPLAADGGGSSAVLAASSPPQGETASIWTMGSVSEPVDPAEALTQSKSMSFRTPEWKQPRTSNASGVFPSSHHSSSSSSSSSVSSDTPPPPSALSFNAPIPAGPPPPPSQHQSKQQHQSPSAAGRSDALAPPSARMNSPEQARWPFLSARMPSDLDLAQMAGDEEELHSPNALFAHPTLVLDPSITSSAHSLPRSSPLNEN